MLLVKRSEMALLARFMAEGCETSCTDGVMPPNVCNPPYASSRLLIIYKLFRSHRLRIPSKDVFVP